MSQHRNNPESEENAAMTLGNQRAVFAAKMMAQHATDAKPPSTALTPPVCSPLRSIHGITFFPVPEFDNAAVSFGPPESAFLPRRDLPFVPRELEDLVQGIFFQGGHLPPLSPQVDLSKAMRAVNAWLRSFAAAHEAKITTVAYALWVWTTLDEANLPLTHGGPAK